MAVTVVIPFTPGQLDRDRAWERVRALYEDHHPDYEIVVGDGDPDRWVKADAVTPAVENAKPGVVVIADADVWTDGLHDAVEAIDVDCRWTIPHLKVHRLAAGQEQPTTDRRNLTEAPYTGYAGGGIVVLDRDAYLTCPLDPRFVGWGQEDSAFALALTTTFGAPWRGAADLWHWWHPPQHRRSRRIGSAQSDALHRRYRKATGDRRQMRDLLDETADFRRKSGEVNRAALGVHPH